MKVVELEGRLMEVMLMKLKIMPILINTIPWLHYHILILATVVMEARIGQIITNLGIMVVFDRAISLFLFFFFFFPTSISNLLVHSSLHLPPPSLVINSILMLFLYLIFPPLSFSSNSYFLTTFRFFRIFSFFVSLSSFLLYLVHMSSPIIYYVYSYKFVWYFKFLSSLSLFLTQQVVISHFYPQKKKTKKPSFYFIFNKKLSFTPNKQFFIKSIHYIFIYLGGLLHNPRE